MAGLTASLIVVCHLKMRNEADCKPQERFLFTDELFSDESIAIWKGECISRVQSRNLEKGAAYERFINWNKSKNEVALFTLYAYADLKIPKQFDCIFDLRNPSNFALTRFTLIQSIYEGWYPIDSIEDGHKHLCVFEFDEKLPDILDGLHVAKGKFLRVPKGALKLGICQSTDFNEIRSRQEQMNDLREKHGAEWWKYDEESK